MVTEHGVVTATGTAAVPAGDGALDIVQISIIVAPDMEPAEMMRNILKQKFPVNRQPRHKRI
jgi:hypothetical protein